MISLAIPIGKDGFAANRKPLEAALFPPELEIVEPLYRLAVDGYSRGYKRADWTRAIRNKLLELGRQGFLTLPRSKGDGFEGEWMFDTVWVDAKPDPSAPGTFDWRHTRALRLACECEWGTNEVYILADFFKLTFALADLRLFIYTNVELSSQEGGKVHPVTLCKQVCPLSRGFRYLAVGFPRDETGELRVDAWTA